jgi:hypothetical protein
MGTEAFDANQKSEKQQLNQRPSISFWDAFAKGTADELAYNEEHMGDAAKRAGIAAGLGFVTAGKEGPWSARSKLAMLGGGVISAAHFLDSEHVDDMNEKSPGNNSIGYAAGRFATDAGATIAVATSSNRVGWNMKGEAGVNAIIDQTEFKSGLHKVTFKESAINPVFRQERAEKLYTFLEHRGQLEKYEGAISKLALKPEAQNVSLIAREQGGTTQVYERTFLKGSPVSREVPVFDPNELMRKAKGQVALKDLKTYNVLSAHW